MPPLVEEAFPVSEMIAAFAELNAWVSVPAIQLAARTLEKRLLPDEAPSVQVLITFQDHDDAESFHVLMMRYLIEAFRCPESQLLLAAGIDPAIKSETLDILRAARFRPTIKVGPAEALHTFAPTAPRGSPRRFMVIRDEAHILDLIYRPVRVWQELVGRGFSLAHGILEMLQKAEQESGGRPKVFHKPTSDSPLTAMIEGLAFYSRGHDVGNATTKPVSTDVDYRNVAIVGKPPFDARAIDSARQLQLRQFEDLRS